MSRVQTHATRTQGHGRRIILAVAVMAAALWITPGAFAHTRVGFGISIGVGNCWRCGYWAPPPVYYPAYGAYPAPVPYPPVYYPPRLAYYGYGYGYGYYAPHYHRPYYHRGGYLHARRHYGHYRHHGHHGHGHYYRGHR